MLLVLFPEIASWHSLNSNETKLFESLGGCRTAPQLLVSFLNVILQLWLLLDSQIFAGVGCERKAFLGCNMQEY